MELQKRIDELEKQLEILKQQFHQTLGALNVFKEQLKESKKEKADGKNICNDESKRKK